MRRFPLTLFTGFLLFTLIGCVTPVNARLPTFDDRDPARLRIANAFYTLTLAKENGAILALTDRQRGQSLLSTTGRNCLWALDDQDHGAPLLESCAVGGDSSTTMRYQWDSTTRHLTLHYTQSAAIEGAPIQVEVTVIPAAAPWFDLQVRVLNNGDRVLRRVSVPADLQFEPMAVQEALLPILPGVLLDQSFFVERTGYEARYPGWPGLFADYVALRVGKSHVALYGIQQAEPLTSAGVCFANNRKAIRLSHTFYPYIPGSRSPDQWRTPETSDWQAPLVRFHIGQPYATTIEAYRAANQLAAFPDLPTKSGERYATLIGSPLYKIEYDRPPAYWESLLGRIPAPALLHWVTYWQVGVFDEDFPDYLPPRGGDTASLAALFALARANGFLNMPYTNPMWWDDESPTVQTLGGAAVALRNRSGTLRYGCYSLLPIDRCTPERAARTSAVNREREPWAWLHGGHPVSPHAPAVQARIAATFAELVETLGSDFVFEDQVGVGNVHCDPTTGDCRDYSPWVPHPTAVLQGWLDHTARYGPVGLMTEVGYDRMAAHQLGFHGSLLLMAKEGRADGWWGAGNWQVYPMASMLLRDKVLFYQHSLAPETFTDNLATLRWNLAMGYQLSYGLNPDAARGGPDDPWLRVVGLFQQRLLAPHVDQRITDYRQLADQVTVTRYDQVRVIANWREDATVTVADHTIAPEGFYWVDAAHQRVAGSFTRYNGVPLPTGVQIILEERTPTSIRLYHPLGNARTIAVKPIAHWPVDATVELIPHNQRDQPLATLTATVKNGLIRVPYRQQIANQPVAYYTVTVAERTRNTAIPRGQ